MENTKRRFGVEEVAFKCQCHHTMKLVDCSCPQVNEKLLVPPSPNLQLTVVVKEGLVFIKNPSLHYENCLPLNQGKLWCWVVPKERGGKMTNERIQCGCFISDEFAITFCNGRVQEFATYFFETSLPKGMPPTIYFPLYDQNTGILFTDLVITMKEDRRGVTLKKRLSYLKGGCYWPSQQAGTSVFLRREEFLILLHRVPEISLALFTSSNKHIAFTLEMINVFGQPAIFKSLIQRHNLEVDHILMLLNNESGCRSTFLYKFVQFIFKTWPEAKERFNNLVNTTNLREQLSKLCPYDVETFQVGFETPKQKDRGDLSILLFSSSSFSELCGPNFSSVVSSSPTGLDLWPGVELNCARCPPCLCSVF